MSLPLLQETRTISRHEFKTQMKHNIKTAREVGISNLGKPEWLKIRPPTKKFAELQKRIRGHGLVTVCEQSHCPNMAECWSGGTATFMVLGDTCTRACKFCAVKARGIPEPADDEEPQKLVRAVGEMNLDYVVITSVDRDDMEDGGAQHFADCISALKEAYPKLLIEVLIGDFQGNNEHLQKIIDAKPTVIAHNIETVKRLQHPVRDRRANYEQSLSVLEQVKKMNSKIMTKTSIMVGLGEEIDELHTAMDDCRSSEIDIITFGQYLQPSTWHLRVERYMTPQEFNELEEVAHEKGFMYCAAGPFVRSSYRAAELFVKGKLEK